MVDHRRPGATSEPMYNTDPIWFDAEPVVLHPSTDPKIIALRHLRLVRYVCFKLGPGATPEAVSEIVILPLWNCQRHMATLGLFAYPEKKAAKGRWDQAMGQPSRRKYTIGEQVEKVRAVLADGIVRTKMQVIAECGLPEWQVERAFRNSTQFLRDMRKGTGYWTLAKVAIPT